jgi:iron complex transport system ATP-binding protein
MIDIEDGASLLSIAGATVVKSGNRILDEISLDVQSGAHTVILGANGSGKSSLIKLITRQYYPLVRHDDRPTVSIFGQSRWNIFELRSLLGIVSSDLASDFLPLPETTGLETALSGYFAAIGLAPHHQVTSEMRDGAYLALERIGASHLADRRIGELSTGEARRVLIARALVTQPKALLLDEPTTGLDIVSRQRFLESVRGLAQTGTTIILVTHHVEEILPEIEHVIFIKNGKIWADGKKSALLNTKALSSLFDSQISLRKAGGYYSAHVELI